MGLFTYGEGNTSAVFCNTWFMSSEDILTEDKTHFCILVCALIIEIQKLLDVVHRLTDETERNNEDNNNSIFLYFYS